MKRLLLQISLLLTIFLFSGSWSAAQPHARAQSPANRIQSQRDSLGWERVLDAYQQFCELTVTARSGDREAAAKLRAQADAISALLQQVKGSGMTPSQQHRFTRMKQRYASVVTLPDLPVAPAPATVQVISGQTVIIRDTVFVVREIHQTDTVRIVEQVEKLVEVPVERVVEVPVPAAIPDVAPETGIVPNRTRYLLLAQVVVPDLSYGAMVGAVHEAGLYVRFDSNFHRRDTEYACTSDGQASYGQIWTTGRSEVVRFAAAGGALWHPVSWLTLYAGAGYGWRSLCWEDVSGNWALVSDASYRGVAADLGAVFSIDRFALSAGVTTIGFGRVDANLGLGIFF